MNDLFVSTDDYAHPPPRPQGSVVNVTALVRTNNLLRRQLEEAKKMIDITGGVVVEVEIRQDGKVVWLHVNGRTVARACQIEALHISDHREPA